MTQPRALILASQGLNCEEETAFAFQQAGARTRILPVDDLIRAPSILSDFQILVIPGGFSYGDDTGAGNAFANRLVHRLSEALDRFANANTLTLGICNGCQILVRMGLIPQRPNEKRTTALVTNTSGRFECRWVDLHASGSSPWLKGLARLRMPVAHGQGRFVFKDASPPQHGDGRASVLRYVSTTGAPAHGAYPANPNGSDDDIAGLTDATGRILGLMPHPERALFFTQRDDWLQLAERYRRVGRPAPETADGMQLFLNAVSYFK